MKTIRPRRRHHHHSHATRPSVDVVRLIMQALQAPVPPQLKTWTRV